VTGDTDAPAPVGGLTAGCVQQSGELNKQAAAPQSAPALISVHPSAALPQSLRLHAALQHLPLFTRHTAVVQGRPLLLRTKPKAALQSLSLHSA
jgi:hypothetical protein